MASIDWLVKPEDVPEFCSGVLGLPHELTIEGRRCGVPWLKCRYTAVIGERPGGVLVRAFYWE